MVEAGVIGIAVTLEVHVPQLQLLIEAAQNGFWYSGRIIEERAEEAQRAELQGHAEAGVVAAACGDDLEVARLEREIRSELLGGGVARVLPVRAEGVDRFGG